MLTLPFEIIPGSTRLFTDYCAGSPSVRNYYVGHFSDPLAFETHIGILEKRAHFRNEIADILSEQNRRFGTPVLAQERIESLRDPKTFVVVTGQQVGLFTGPLYTLYKAMTARHLADWLTEYFPGCRFLPLFWLESEDHDLDEAGSSAFIDAENNVLEIRYEQTGETEQRNLRPVGSIPLDDRIAEIIDTIEHRFPQTDYTGEMLKTLRRAYTPGTTFTEAFVSMFHSLFPESGIIFVDPSDSELKKLLAPVILQELETYPASGEEVIKRSAELEERYHAQVKPRAVNLFYLHRGGRYPIEPSEFGFFLRGTRQRFTRDELLDIANVHPEYFSPNVLLRPIFQDFLFPTAAYIAGPAEVAYFGQLQPVYDHFQVPMPVIVPRASVTIIEPKIRKLFNKFDLPLESMFSEPEELYAHLPRTSATDDQIAAFDALKRDMCACLDRLPSIGSQAFPQLAEPANETVRNIRRYLSLFEERLMQAHRQRDTVVQRQLEKFHLYLAPTGKPQERVYNVLTYLNRYGPSFLSRLAAECTPFPAEHRLLFL
ncbi:MAG: bacillithiol biosynthesis cysteine-adding enzyme BshC [Bacteroidota bacterium]|nr:bacillithiol biosynthesis cysteine-adding enzyme BshC [Bacteroidota bacterium]